MTKRVLDAEDDLDVIRKKLYPQPAPVAEKVAAAAAAAASGGARAADGVEPTEQAVESISKEELKKALVGVNPNKKKEQFRNYELQARESVRELYREMRTKQTYAYAKDKRDQYAKLEKCKMGVWEAMEFLNKIVDDSDPDTDLSQMAHALQTAEAIRKDGHPRWMILTGLIHDLGKVLCQWGEPQWAVVGDTFVTGCAYAEQNVFAEYFAENPDAKEAKFATECGVYERGCGFDQVVMSWGHDEYIYHVCKDYLPQEGLAMLRYHSFYPWHRGGAYTALENDKDREMKKWILLFNKYDLYTKSHDPPNVEEVKPFYLDLIAEFFPAKIKW